MYIPYINAPLRTPSIKARQTLLRARNSEDFLRAKRIWLQYKIWLFISACQAHGRCIDLKLEYKWERSTVSFQMELRSVCPLVRVLTSVVQRSLTSFERTVSALEARIAALFRSKCTLLWRKLHFRAIHLFLAWWKPPPRETHCSALVFCGYSW